MRTPGLRATIVTTALTVVGLGAVALAGLVHPAAPDPAFASSLPRITLSAVLVAAAVDGVNPCAFTVLLLMVTAVLAGMHEGVRGRGDLRAKLLSRGGLFIVAIFITYLAVGVGAMGTLGLLTRRHWPARIAALLAVLAGLWMMKDYFLPESRWQLKAPGRTADLARAAARRGTVPALFAGGVLIGLCTVPCSGAVYLGVLSLLSLQSDRMTGYGYLLLYNLVFVLPLVAILAAATARPTLRWATAWNRLHGSRVRLVLGSGVVVGGLAILATV